MQRVAGPRRIPGGFYHFLTYQNQMWGIELRLPDFAAQLSFLEEEGLTVISLTPCCVQSLASYPLTGEAKNPNEWSPYACGYCGAEAALPGIIDTWWQVGSTDTLTQRLEYYLEAWGHENVLANEVRAQQIAELILILEPHLAVLRGRASAWPRAQDE